MLDLFSVQDGNGEWSDTTARAPFVAGDSVEEGGAGSIKPLIRLAKEWRLKGRSGGRVHGRAVLVGGCGQIDHELPAW